MLLSLSLSVSVCAQAVKSPDTLEDFVSEVSRDNLRQIEKEYYQDKHKRGPVSTQVSDSLLARGKSRTWTLVFTKKDDKLMKGPGTSMWFSSEPEKDSFRTNGFQVYPHVTVYVEPALQDKVKQLRPGRKFQVSGVISEVSLKQNMVLIASKVTQTRMGLSLSIQASEVGPAK